MQIKALHNQTLLDIAIQYCGTINALVSIAILNNLSITGDLLPGQNIEIPKTDFGFKEVINFFNLNKIQPATAYSTNQLEINDTGIDFWIIENDFNVQ